MKWEIIGQKKHAGGGGRGVATYDLKISKHSNDRIQFTLSALLMSRLGWHDGDLVVLIMAPDGELAGLQRTQSPRGMKLSCPDKKETARGAVKFSRSLAAIRKILPFGLSREFNAADLLIDNDSDVVCIQV